MRSQNAPLQRQLNAINTQLRRPVAFYVLLAEVGGSPAAGLFLSQTLYWTERTSDPDGWFYKKRDDWTKEIGLSRTQQESVRRLLRTRGLLYESKRGVPPTLHYRLDLDRLNAAVSRGTKQPSEKAGSPPVMRRAFDPMSGSELAECPGEVPPNNKGTENTSKNTAEISAMISHAIPPKSFTEVESETPPTRGTAYLTTAMACDRPTTNGEASMFARGVRGRLELPADALLYRVISDAIDVLMIRNGQGAEQCAEFLIERADRWRKSPDYARAKGNRWISFFVGQHYDDDPASWEAARAGGYKSAREEGLEAARQYLVDQCERRKREG